MTWKDYVIVLCIALAVAWASNRRRIPYVNQGVTLRGGAPGVQASA